MPQSNYLLTQYINSADVKEVLIDLAYRFTSGGYERTYDVLVFETNEPDAQASANPNNYRLLSRQTPADANGVINLSFEVSTGKNGFYISVLETGACLTLTYMRVYTQCCKRQTANLVQYPTANAPARSSLVPVVKEGQCSAMSSAVDSTGSPGQCQREEINAKSSVEVQCLKNGLWSESSSCSCDPGFVLEGSQCVGECI